jgi:hypothetical protein
MVPGEKHATAGGFSIIAMQHGGGHESKSARLDATVTKQQQLVQYNQ